MSERFYTSSPLNVGPTVLQGSQAHHLATVCRVKPGEVVILFNGDGHEYPAEVVSLDRKSVALQVRGRETPSRERTFRLAVAASLPKGDRADFLIEKLTEIGATDFTPLRTQRSVVHPHDAKLERLRQSVIEASKQCGRTVLMQIRELADWSQFCRRQDVPHLRLLAHPRTDSTLPGEIATTDLCVAVGPEGGWTEHEIDLARDAGWQCVSLGPRILRVETAALVMAAWAVQPQAAHFSS